MTKERPGDMFIFFRPLQGFPAFNDKCNSVVTDFVDHVAWCLYLKIAFFCQCVFVSRFYEAKNSRTEPSIKTIINHPWPSSSWVIVNVSGWRCQSFGWRNLVLPEKSSCVVWQQESSIVPNRNIDKISVAAAKDTFAFVQKVRYGLCFLKDSRRRVVFLIVTTAHWFLTWRTHNMVPDRQKQLTLNLQVYVRYIPFCHVSRVKYRQNI